MTTLADMTPQERSEYRGMWCEIYTPAGPELAIYDQLRWTKEPTLFEPEYGHFEADLSKVTPRFDLPRAWNPDGQPPAGGWEDDYTDSDGITLTTGEDLDLGPHQEVRRWIGEWEEA